ncbi:MAG: UDP-N-acetylglucosamine 1-carboxyvinyltransferase [Candidatus Pacebacteria bacterium]|nr:UDP-N-acetylglucosamine 1-carboxyvinyltransferase [Candidatus Paceibacterota bacterium]
MREQFVIQGGTPLKGEVQIRGAKNSTFPILAATLLTKEPCVIDNFPLIEDALKMLEILKEIGSEITWLGERKIKIVNNRIDPLKMPNSIITKFRGSVLLIGPLLARFKKVRMPFPGGCLIGARSIDTHLDAFLQLGIDIKKEKFYTLSFKKIKNNQVVLREISVTGTENILLFSALQKKIIIDIADQDYANQELALVLSKMGTKIKSGFHCFEISGKKQLKGFSHFIHSDPIETGTFIVAALATKGEIIIKKANLVFLKLFLKRLKDFGAEFKILNQETIKVFSSNKLRIDKIQSLPYPGISTDLQPELGVLATQNQGPTLIHDPLYEGRLKYLEQLNKMGANIFFSDPHRAIINGPTPLKGVEMSSMDLRAGAAFLIAGLAAKGKTIINDVYQIDRGYEKIEQRFIKLGANIKRICL